LLTSLSLSALPLVGWDIPGGANTTALTSSVATGVSASAITLSGLNINQSSSVWRTRGYNDSTTRYITFSVSAAPGSTVTLQELIFTANAQAGTGAVWTAPALRLEYSQSADFAVPASAGTLELGPDLTGPATGAQITAGAATFFGTDLTIQSGETYYFRLVGLGANNSSQNQISYLSSADMQLNGTVESASANLVWAGADGANWNTTEANFTKDGSPSAFAMNDNVTITTPGTIQLDAGGLTAGILAHSSATGTTTLNGGNLTLGSLFKSEAGILALNGPVTVATGAGLTTLAGGTIQVLDGATLSTSGLLLSGGGTLQVESGGVLASGGPNSLETGGATLDLDVDLSLANIANLVSNNPLAKLGSGTLTVSGIGTQITGAVDLDILGGAIIASGPVGSTRQINIGGENTFDGNLTLNGPVLMLHGSTVSGTGSILINGSTSSITSRFNQGTVNLNVPVVLSSSLNIESPNGNNTLRFNAAISGDHDLIKKGNGTAVFVANQSYTGSTTVEAGILRIGGGGTTGSLGTGSVSLLNTTTVGTLLFDRSDAIVVPNLISGQGNVTLAGDAASQVTLSGANTYTGVTTLTRGTLGVPLLADGYEDSSIGASAPDADRLVLNGGTLAHTGPAASTDREFTLGINGGTIAAGGSGALQWTSDADVFLAEPTPVTVGGLTLGFNYRIVDPGDTDFTLIGAPDNSPGTRFEATGPGSGTGTVVFANTRPMRLSGNAPGVSVFALALTDAANAPTSLVKNDIGTWSITAPSSYTGPTQVNAGILRIDGNNSAATGTVNVAAGATLGGNGSSGGAVVMAANSRLAVTISDWTGTAGTGYEDLSAASFNGGSGAFEVVVSTTGLTNFSEADRSFTILNTSGGITGLNPSLVTVSAPGFPGAGYWSVSQSGNSLLLEYSLTQPDPFLAWIGPFAVSDPAKGADPDNDGSDNLLEFVLNGNPGQSDPSILPGAETTATHLVIGFSRRIDSVGIAQVIQYGTNLSGWTDLAIPVEPGGHDVGVATINVVRDGEAGTDRITVLIPRGGTQLFARLLVQ
jgi:fibronectin-binding autotransporter adhesin